MARIVSIGAALQDVYLIDDDDFGTNKRGFFNQIELGSKLDIDNIHFSTFLSLSLPLNASRI